MGRRSRSRGWGSLPVDQQEVGHEAQQGGYGGGDGKVALKVVLEAQKWGAVVVTWGPAFVSPTVISHPGACHQSPSTQVHMVSPPSPT